MPIRRSLPLLLLLIACSDSAAPLREWTPEDHGHPASADPARTPAATPEAQSPEEARARAARALFNVSCAGCHGRDGRGGGPSAPPGAQIPDLSDPQLHAQRSDAQLAAVIAEGRGLMPGFGEQIKTEGIEVLVRYVRGFAPQPEGAPTAGEDPGGAPQPSEGTTSPGATAQEPAAEAAAGDGTSAAQPSPAGGPPGDTGAGGAEDASGAAPAGTQPTAPAPAP